MDGYHLAKFVHVVNLLAAIAASAVIHLALLRRDRARTVGEMAEWHDLVLATSKVFPVALATFVLSGTYMIRAGALQVWSSGFVIAGLTGVVILLVNGIVLGTRGRGLKRRLDEAMRAGGAGEPAPALVHDVVTVTLPWVNLGIVLGVVFDMTNKPALGPALGVVGLAIVVSATAAWVRRPRAAADVSTA